MATAKSKKKEKRTSFNVGKNLTIDNIAKINRDFMDCVDRNEEVLIEANNIDNIDLTGIQFLIYAKQIAAMKNSKVSYTVSYSDNITSLLRKTGFGHILDMNKAL